MRLRIGSEKVKLSTFLLFAPLPVDDHKEASQFWIKARFAPANLAVCAIL
jgi:hypothetical protein